MTQTTLYSPLFIYVELPTAGIGAHHAGLEPSYKRLVGDERGFVCRRCNFGVLAAQLDFHDVYLLQSLARGVNFVSHHARRAFTSTNNPISCSHCRGQRRQNIPKRRFPILGHGDNADDWTSCKSNQRQLLRTTQ